MKKIKKYTKHYLIFFLIVLCFLTFFVFSSGSEKKLLMNDLEYIVKLNDDGSATITENWDIYIGHINTLFRNFENGRGYDEITDVSVKDVESGKVFTKIYQEMYHVTTNCFYALPIDRGLFEIAWGTGMENSTKNKKYQIKYTVENVVTKYEDVEEFYWKLLSPNNDIPVKNVKGTIYLPSSVKNLENLKVWGHGPLDGQIHKVDTNKVEFHIKDLEPKTMLEVRVATAEKMFNNSSKIRNYRYLNTMISEETAWANKSN